MPSFLDKKFYFSNDLDIGNTVSTTSKVCIVGIFGKSRLSPFSSKATCLNSVIDRDVFQGTEGFLQKQIDQGQIECFYDDDSQVMYLHLLSFNDINQLARECQQLSQSGNMKDFYSKWQSEDYTQAKNLAFLFSMCHILLLHHPGSCFDLSYLRLFHNLDHLRIKLQSHMCDLLSSVSGVSKDWTGFGRVCTPRMLFMFETPTIDIQPEDCEGGGGKFNKKNPPMRKLQMAIEDAIFRILRKTRAITDISNNSLFSVPLNQPYVYIQARRSEICDPVDFLLSQIRIKCFSAKEESPHSGMAASMAQGGQGKAKPYSASRRVRPNPPVPEPLPLSVPSWKSSALRNNVNSTQSLSSLSTSSSKQQSVSSSSPIINTSSSLSSPVSSLSSAGSKAQEQSLKEFLWQHIEMVFNKSVNDNKGRHRIEPVLELPNLNTWLRAAHCIFNFFFPAESQDSSVPQPLITLKNSLDISMKFSESRCQKWMSSAENTYQQDLPSFYVTSYHQSRLAKAKRMFSQYARGPAFSKYLCELEMWCEAYWKAGRQQCEAVSLSGNLCTLQRHYSPIELKNRQDDSIPVAEHCSGLRTRSACNCGRKQAEKEDPFSHKYANHTFYEQMEVNCCGNLEHISLPVFVTSTSDPSPVSHTPPRSDSSRLPSQTRQDQHHTHDGADSQKVDTFSTLSDLSWALSFDQQSNATTIDPPAKLSQSLHSPAGDKSCQSMKDSVDPAEMDTSVVKKEEDVALEEKTQPLRQISTTEYLSSMIHTRSPSGLLPKFSSFSLCRLGPASFYSHVIGLDMPGFLPGSSFLLPWDILVKHESREKWPTVTETFGPKKRQQRKLSKVTMDSAEIQTTVRVYLGMEYECPRGHRFFCSGPDKIIKVSANSSVKDNAGRLVQMDMPLYTLCHCNRQPKGCLAQMMRVFIVTPKDSPNCPSVRVQANPIIQANPAPCPQFHPGLDSALELPSDGVWVLRLPHIYQDDECVYLMPSDPQRLHSCYLIKGTFSHRIV